MRNLRKYFSCEVFGRGAGLAAGAVPGVRTRGGVVVNQANLCAPDSDQLRVAGTADCTVDDLPGPAIGGVEVVLVVVEEEEENRFQIAGRARAVNDMGPANAA